MTTPVPPNPAGYSMWPGSKSRQGARVTTHGAVAGLPTDGAVAAKAVAFRPLPGP
jgi:hypothetical protein